MGHPTFERLPNICLADRNDEILASRRALPIQRSQIAFALGALRGVFNTVIPNVFQSSVQIAGVDMIPIVDDESISVVSNDAFSKLL
jgi:hypothetical protein